MVWENVFYMALKYLPQIWIYISQGCDGSEIFCHLQANKLACQHLMGAGSKHEIPGSETWIVYYTLR